MSEQPFQIGNRVQHDAIGEGTVTEIDAHGTIYVEFDRTAATGAYSKDWFAIYPDSLKRLGSNSTYGEWGWI